MLDPRPYIATHLPMHHFDHQHTSLALRFQLKNSTMHSVCLRKAACLSSVRVQQPSRKNTRFVVRSTGGHPSLKDIEEVDKKVEEAIKEAEQTCKDSDAAHCAAAWDNVEELSAAAAHKKVAYNNDPVSNDPLEQFCDDNPDADECRVYDD